MGIEGFAPPAIDPIEVALEWLPRMPPAGRGMLATLIGALDLERRAHARTRLELEGIHALFKDLVAERRRVVELEEPKPDPVVRLAAPPPPELEELELEAAICWRCKLPINTDRLCSGSGYSLPCAEPALEPGELPP